MSRGVGGMRCHGAEVDLPVKRRLFVPTATAPNIFAPTSSQALTAYVQGTPRVLLKSTTESFLRLFPLPHAFFSTETFTFSKTFLSL